MNFPIAISKYAYTVGQWLVLISLFLPTLIFDQYVFPYITPRNFLFRILMLAGLGIVVLLWANTPSLRPKKNWLTIAVVTVIVAKILSGIFGVNLYNSFWSNYERMEGIVGWLFFGVYYFLLITVFRTKKDWQWLFRISLLPALYICLYGIFQHLGWFGVMESRQARIESRLGNAAYLGAYMLIYVGIAGYVWLRDSQKLWRWFAIACGVLFHITLFLTATRGAFLGWGVGVFVAAILYILWGPRKKIKILLASGLLALLLVVVGVRAGSDTAFVRNIEPLKRIATVSLTDATVQSRLVVWKIALQGFQDRPILGWGQDNFYYIYNKYFDEAAREQWVDRAHNNLLDQLSMGGLLTFVSYLALLLLPLIYFWNHRRVHVYESIVLLAVWFAYITQNQFVFDSLNTYLLFFILVAYAHAIHVNTRGQDEQEAVVTFENKLAAPILTITIVGLVVVGLVGHTILNRPAHAANKMFIQSLVNLQNNPERAIQLTKDAVALNSFGNKEIGMQGLTIVSTVINNPNFSNELKVNTLLFVIDVLEQALEREPDEVRVMLTLEQLYSIANTIDPAYMERARLLLERARAIGPGRTSVYFPLAQIALNNNDIATAERLLQTTIELNPRSYEGHMNLMQVLLLQDKHEQALVVAQHFEENNRSYFSDSHKALVAQVYIQNELWESALVYLEELVTEDPENVGYLQLLGQTYYSLGAIEKVIEIDERIEMIEGDGEDSFILEAIEETVPDDE